MLRRTAERRPGARRGPFPVRLLAAPDGSRYLCSQIGSFERAQELLRQGHTYLDRNSDGVACESLRR
jgi:hypothetical protein